MPPPCRHCAPSIVSQSFRARCAPYQSPPFLAPKSFLKRRGAQPHRVFPLSRLWGSLFFEWWMGMEVIESRSSSLGAVAGLLKNQYNTLSLSPVCQVAKFIDSWIEPTTFFFLFNCKTSAKLVSCLVLLTRLLHEKRANVRQHQQTVCAARPLHQSSTWAVDVVGCSRGRNFWPCLSSDGQDAQRPLRGQHIFQSPWYEFICSFSSFLTCIGWVLSSSVVPKLKEFRSHFRVSLAMLFLIKKKGEDAWLVQIWLYFQIKTKIFLFFLSPPLDSCSSLLFHSFR